MNNSQRTAVIAHGIYLWARVQNLPGSEARDATNPQVRAWSEWARVYPRYVPFVKEEQFALFDRVNTQL